MRSWPRAVTGWLAWPLLLAAAACWTLWLIATLWTDRTLFTQYLFWGRTLLLCAAVLAGLVGLLLSLCWANTRRARTTRRALLTIGLLSVVWSAWQMLGLRSMIAPPAALKPGEPSLTILHWNGTRDATVPPKAFLGKLANEPVPDILAITAFLPGATRIELARHAHDERGGAIAPGLSLYSRFPVLGSRVVSIDVAAARDAAAPTSPRLTKLGQWVFAQAHATWREGGTPDVAGLLAVQLDTRATLGRPTTVYLIDLPSNPALSRRRVAELVARHLRELQGDAKNPLPAPDLVLGDFNTPRGSGSLDLLAPAMSEAADAAGPGWLATWPRERPLLHLDHAFAAPWLRAVEYRLIDPGRSEHVAQWLRLTPAAK